MLPVKLIGLDVDGTLLPFGSDSFRDLNFGLIALLSSLARADPELRFVLITNQGGPACYDNGWGEKYPTFNEVTKKLEGLRVGLKSRLGATIEKVYACWAFFTDTGELLLPQAVRESGEYLSPGWCRWWRKPGPGMLIRACADLSVEPAYCLYIGDSDDDALAARNADWQFLKVAHYPHKEGQCEL